MCAPFQRLGGRTLIALDGTEHFCSRKIHCKRLARPAGRSDGWAWELLHSFWRSSAGHTASPLTDRRQDGAEKQDCERKPPNDGSRHGPAVAQLRPVYLGDGASFACQPIAEAIHRVGGSFILTFCKPASHQTVSEYLHGTTSGRASPNGESHSQQEEIYVSPRGWRTRGASPGRIESRRRG